MDATGRLSKKLCEIPLISNELMNKTFMNSKCNEVKTYRNPSLRHLLLYCREKGIAIAIDEHGEFINSITGENIGIKINLMESFKYQELVHEQIFLFLNQF